MAEVIYTDEFGAWFDALTESDAESIMNVVDMLEIAGIALATPHSSALRGTELPFRELRPKQGRSPIRVVYAFDPRRQAVLLIGGSKGADKKFYPRILKKAEVIWKEYLVEQTSGKHDK